MRIIIKLISYFLIFLFLLIFIEMVSISSKYQNRPFFSMDINNIRNPQIKKITRASDNFYTYLLLKFSKAPKTFNSRRSKFKEIPEFKIISADNFTISNLNNQNNLNDWTRSHGNQSFDFLIYQK